MLITEWDHLARSWVGFCETCHNVDDEGGAIPGTQYFGTTEDEVWDLYLEHADVSH